MAKKPAKNKIKFTITVNTFNDFTIRTVCLLRHSVKVEPLWSHMLNSFPSLFYSSTTHHIL